jgi:hypothetical protein
VTAKSVAEKLLVRPGAAVWVSDPGRAALLGELPPEASLAGVAAGAAVVVMFVASEAEARASLEAHAADLRTAGAFWVAYPKGGRADVNRDSLWPILAEFGFRPISQVAIDETWSALRFRVLTAGEAPFTGGR